MLLSLSKKKSSTKEKYVTPTLAVIQIPITDVITTSGEVGGEWPWSMKQPTNFG